MKKTRSSYEDLRKDENKQWREGWVASKFCKYANWNNALICFPSEDKGDDVFIKYDEKYYPFQIAEMAPRDPAVAKNLPESKEDENGLVTCEVYGSLEPRITTLIEHLVQKKNKKFYADQENMNLLVYLNSPDALFIDAEEDINTNVLTKKMQSSKFKTISLLSNGEIIFIKGSVEDLAQGIPLEFRGTILN